MNDLRKLLAKAFTSDPLEQPDSIIMADTTWMIFSDPWATLFHKLLGRAPGWYTRDQRDTWRRAFAA